MLDALWTNCAEDPDKIGSQQQACEFIKIKEEEVRGISEHFEHLNKREIDGVPDDDEENPKEKKGKPSSTQPKTKK